MCTLSSSITLQEKHKPWKGGNSYLEALLSICTKLCLSEVSLGEQLTLVEVLNSAQEDDRHNYHCYVLRVPCLRSQTNSNCGVFDLIVRHHHCFPVLPWSNGAERCITDDTSPSVWMVRGSKGSEEQGGEESAGASIAHAASRHSGSMVSVMRVLQQSGDQTLCLFHCSRCHRRDSWTEKRHRPTLFSCAMIQMLKEELASELRLITVWLRECY